MKITSIIIDVSIVAVLADGITEISLGRMDEMCIRDRAYTSSALSFMFENLTKPVILTGSQLPIEIGRAHV